MITCVRTEILDCPCDSRGVFVTPEILEHQNVAQIQRDHLRH